MRFNAKGLGIALSLVLISSSGHATENCIVKFFRHLHGTFSSELRQAKAWKGFYDQEIANSGPGSRYMQPARSETEWRSKSTTFTDVRIYRGLGFIREISLAEVEEMFFSPNPKLAPHALESLSSNRLSAESKRFVAQFDSKMRENKEAFRDAVVGHTGAAGPYDPFLSFAKDRKYAMGFTEPWDAGYAQSPIKSNLLVSIRMPKRGVIDRLDLSRKASVAKTPLAIVTPEDEVLYIGTIDPDCVEDILLINKKYRAGGMGAGFDIFDGIQSITRVYRDPKDHSRVLTQKLDPKDADPALIR